MCKHKPCQEHLNSLLLWMVALGATETLKIKCVLCGMLIPYWEYKKGKI